MTQKTPREIIALIVAAGSAVRFGSSIPKQYSPLLGEPVLRHTLRAFLNCPAVTHIQVIIQDGHQIFYQDAITGLAELLPPVIGGTTRQQSVRNGLTTLSNLFSDDAIVLIHDAARPCVEQQDLQRLIDTLTDPMKDHPAATLAAPLSDTLRRSKDSVLTDMIARDHVWSLQTPQGFRLDDITAAHLKFANQAYTDDTTLASDYGLDITPVTASRSNIKITYPEDIQLAEMTLLANLPRIPRTAMGFDVHAFGEESTHIRVGGIDIPHSHKLQGHSDADVALHAITDALYGLIADGDIGSHFPPSNAAYKGMDSSVFLKDAVTSVIKAGGHITFIDTTIICEAPKIGPHRDTIRARIAEICNLDIRQVSVKATTTEQLGFTGRREGIAAQAVVTGLF